MGESLQDKFRRSKMITGNEERVVVENGSVWKLRDNKMYRREIYLMTIGMEIKRKDESYKKRQLENIKDTKENAL